jgi:hypothetical protein
LFLVPAAIFFGMHSAFYWWGYHGLFIKSEDSAHYGQSLGELELLSTIAVIATPLLGALIINFAGYNSSFIFAAGSMLISLLFLGRKGDKSQKHDINLVDVFKSMFKHKDSTIAYMSSGGEGTFTAFAWPLFLYLFFGSVLELGAFITASVLIAAIASVFIGKKIDQQGEKGVILASAPIVAFSWFAKALSQVVPILIFAESIRNIGERMLSMSLTNLSYKKANEGYAARALFFREVSLIIGAMLTLGTFGAWIYVGYGFMSFLQ